MARQSTLAGMPLAPGDVFVCSGIGEPEPAPRRRPPAAVPDLGVWLVLRACWQCRGPAGYCPRHWVKTTAERLAEGGW